MKTKSSAKKRFKVTGSERLKESMLLKVTSWLKKSKKRKLALTLSVSSQNRYEKHQTTELFN
jgi:ribosomal protein L35